MAKEKQLGFHKDLHRIVLNGSKTITWRLWDDKDLQKGDIVTCVDMITREPFAKAKIIKVWEKPMGELEEKDKDNHEKFLSDEEMYRTYSSYYKRPVDKSTIVKIIKFKLIEG